MSIRTQERRRVLLRKLSALARTALFGTPSESYRTCGQPTCRCHQGEKHGPHLYLSFRGAEGKTTGHYVPQDLADAARSGITAWHEAQDVLRELAEINREELWDSRVSKAKK
jgi:hypothetical protein